MTGWDKWREFIPPPDEAEDTAHERTEKPLTVGQLAGQIRSLLEGKFRAVWVEGEVSGFKLAQSGHAYFALKDEDAVIDCVIWRSQVPRAGPLPSDGDHVEVRGSLTTYTRGSRYQIVVTKIEPAGIGKLYQRFVELKNRLESEGLFAQARKRPLPPYPKTVGVVTSPRGAAIRDIIKILRRRAPQVRIVIYPARVQGEGSAQEVARAIRRMNELGLADVLIVGRGGGSLEDLWAFNEEIVARAIAASKIPVISAVGHETDFTIADFVADLRAPTPSAAAEIVSANAEDLRRRLRDQQRRMKNALDQKLTPFRRAGDLTARLRHAVRHRGRRLEKAREFQQRLVAAARRRLERLPAVELLRERLLHRQGEIVARRRRALERFALLLDRKRPLQLVNELRQHLDNLQGRLERAVHGVVARWHQRYELLDGKLVALDPKAILARGYSITFDTTTNKVLKSARAAGAGTPLRIVLYEGELAARVTEQRLPDRGPAAAQDRKANGSGNDELPLDFDGDSAR